MKALLCREHGPPDSLVLEDVESAALGPSEVRVRVMAAGVNFPDTLIIEGKYQYQPPLPFSPGSEIAGIVTELGAKVDRVRSGDRVIAVLGHGGLAEEVICSPSQLVPMPDDVEFTTGAALLFTYGTSHYALRDRARLTEGETLVVLGASGGVGLAAVQLGTAMGARVIAAASTEEKLAVCRAEGASETINYASEDLKTRIKELTQAEGADVVLDPVGGPYSEQAVRALGWDGRFLVIGFTAGEIPKIPLNLVLLKSCSIVGVFWGAFLQREPARNEELMAELFGWLRAGKIRPRISKTYPLEQAADALNDLAERRAVGKLVITMT
ncbi:MAG: NADPH:quinone oxidoreductase family protein [Actinomycetota bacterium]